MAHLFGPRVPLKSVRVPLKYVSVRTSFASVEPHAALADEQIQATLLAEAMAAAEVGVVVWDDDRHYVAANRKACELIGCTIEELLGSEVGSHTPDGEATIEQAIRSRLTRGRIEVERFDGRPATLEYVTFPTRTAGLPHMASVIWEADGE
jgi:PAS domain S-box-containing protein